MIGHGLDPRFGAPIQVASLLGGFATRGVEADQLHEFFVLVFEGGGIGHKFDVAAKQADGIHHVDLLAFLPLDVFLRISEPRSYGSRCGKGETHTVFEVAPESCGGTIEGVVRHPGSSVVDGDLWMTVVVGGSCFFTQLQLSFGRVEDRTAQLGFVDGDGLFGEIL